ncbi:MAG: DEAD/DEAH box helicase [Alphaproteobacteria bacterium]|nr:DEAD/DEAH box helicase [Alphaproteobacteria bacterium]
MQIQLMPHQDKALDQTEPFNRVAYYLDMGLGKTFVGSEKMAKLGATRNLVVCQKTKVPDWMDHFKTYYPDAVTYDMTDPFQFNTYVSSNGDPVIGVVNYDLIFRRPILKEFRNITLLLDESSLIQNESAKRSKFVLGMKPENVILLSGTPTGGKYERLWSQLHLLGWDISKDLYWKQYIETEWTETDQGFFRKDVVGYKNVDRLKKKLADHGAVFMKSEDAGVHLPEQTFVHVRVKTPSEYWTFAKRRLITVDGHELVGDTILTARLYSRQLCGLYNAARYEAFMDLVESTDDRVIVFYNFTDEMNRMRELLDGTRPISVINGEGSDLTAYESFGNAITFVQYQAGAMGVNLQKANKTIYFSLCEGSELFEQSKARTHRIGQAQPCFYYILECPNTLEEDIWDTLQMRKDYTDELFQKYQKTHI